MCAAERWRFADGNSSASRFDSEPRGGGGAASTLLGFSRSGEPPSTSESLSSESEPPRRSVAAQRLCI